MRKVFTNPVAWILMPIIGIIACGTWISARGRTTVLLSLYASRVVKDRENEYLFVTRGVRAGMSYESVVGHMKGAFKITGLGKIDRERSVNVGDMVEPYSALFVFEYTASEDVLGIHFEAASIAEFYSVYFDEAKRAVRIEYDRIDAGRGHQKINIDLKQETMSEPLQLAWRQ